jgi:hypothetical protein
MSGRIITFSLVLFFMACKGKNHIPSDIIPPSKMQSVLYDVMRADQFVSGFVIKNKPADSLLSKSLGLYQQIFTLHKVSKVEFDRSFKFYKEHPDLFKGLMDSIGRRSLDAPTQMIDPSVTEPVSDTGKLKKVKM